MKKIINKDYINEAKDRLTDLANKLKQMNDNKIAQLWGNDLRYEKYYDLEDIMDLIVYI